MVINQCNSNYDDKKVSLKTKRKQDQKNQEDKKYICDDMQL